MLYLRETDVEQLIDMPAAIPIVEEAFRQLHAGTVANVPRQRAKGGQLVLHTMSAVLDYLNLGGWKAYSTTRTGARFHVGLYDATTGQPLALIEADQLGQLRTGATTGVAIKHLAQPAATKVGLIGAGWQAESQLEAAAAVLPDAVFTVFSRRADDRSAFCTRMSDRLRREVRSAASARDAVSGQHVVITATSSRAPVLEADWVADGALVCAVGSNWLQKSEIPAELFPRLSAVVCDSIEACRHEAGEFVAPLAAGTFDWLSALELSAVVAGASNPARNGPLLFKSVGLALEDVAVAGHVLSAARTAGIGREIPAQNS